MALFLQRAKAALPTFASSTANLRLIADICTRLDGLPLAIELAAARVRLLPLKALLAQLTDPLMLLRGKPWMLPERHRTLRDALKWSYDLLGPDERALFRLLSVFSGGCTLESIEALWQRAEPDRSHQDVLALLSTLLDCSLIQRREQEDTTPRFFLLETVREFGQECLREHGEFEAISRAHAEYFLAVAQEVSPRLHDSDDLKCLALLEQEHDNLRAALQWAITHNETVLARSGYALCHRAAIDLMCGSCDEEEKATHEERSSRELIPGKFF